MDFSHFGLFLYSDFDPIFLSAQKELSDRIGLPNSKSFEVFEKSENLMWIYSILIFFSSKQAFYRLPALTQSQATGFDLWKTRAEIERTTTI